MLKKLDIYIIKKFLGTFFFALLLILGIAIIFDVSEKIDDFIEKEAPIRAIVFDYYLNFIPYFANLFAPLFVFIAVIFFTSKMAFDTEIIAILSSGISFRRLLLPYFISALILAILSFSLGNFIIPSANKTRLEFKEIYIRNKLRNSDKNIHKQIESGSFIYMDSYTIQSNIGYKFVIENFADGKLKTKIISDFIKWDTTKNKWTIHNYVIREIIEEIEDSVTIYKEIIEKGKTMDTTLNILPKDFARRDEIVETMNMFRLDEFIEEQRMQGATNVDIYLVEKYKRIAVPFSTFILTLIGLSISSRKTRGGIGIHLALGFLLSFSYILFMQLSTNIALGGSMPVILGIWIPNIIFAIIGLFLYYKAPK